MVPHHDDPISLRDAETAERIARAAARGRGADRSPTLDQLLRAFDEPAATPEARRRIAAALALAGIRSVPSVLEAPEGARVTLGGLPAGRSRASRRALAGVGALGLLLGGAGLASGVVGSSGSGERLDALPAGKTEAAVAQARSRSAPTPAVPATATSDDATRAATTRAAAKTTPSAEAPAPATAGTPAQDEAEEKAATKKAAAKKPTKAKKKKKKKKTSTRVKVRLSPAAPTYLCVDDGAGKVLFKGTLSQPRTFTSKRIRLNVGLASTRVTVNGKQFALSGSPAGADLSKGTRVALPLGQRPCA